MSTIIDTMEAKKVIYALAGAAATASGIWWFLSRLPYVHDARGKSPPGPKRKLIVGDIRDFPTTGWMEEFRKLQEEYGRCHVRRYISTDMAVSYHRRVSGQLVGDIVYFQIPGRPVLVLNSFEDAEDLLVKRAAIWSDRPHNYMVDKM
jgi:hypothetical protein